MACHNTDTTLSNYISAAIRLDKLRCQHLANTRLHAQHHRTVVTSSPIDENPKPMQLGRTRVSEEEHLHACATTAASQVTRSTNAQRNHPGLRGVEMDLAKVKVVTDWPEPTSVKELQRFLGFANFYQRFIRSYSTVASPLTSLLRGKPKKLSWTAPACEAFAKLRQSFTTAPILHHPNPEAPFMVEVDASNSGIVAVLSQREGGSGRPRGMAPLAGGSSSPLPGSYQSPKPGVSTRGETPETTSSSLGPTTLDPRTAKQMPCHSSRKYHSKLIPLKGLPTAFETATALFNHVFRTCGLPKDIVSYRGSQFISQVWHAFCRQLGINVNLSLGYHPQSNGQAERLYQEIGQFLRTCCSREQHRWSKYAQNSLMHSAMGLTPFLCILGYQPPLFSWSSEPSEVPAMDDWVGRSQEVWERAHVRLQRTVWCHKLQADHCRRQHPTYQVGQRVWLSTQNLRLRLPCCKLSPKFVDLRLYAKSTPFRTTFHVSLLKPVHDHQVPDPCITNAARAQGIFSSLHMPDKVLNFVKDHFLMDSVIRSQPLLVQRNVHYIQITVHRVQAVHRAYNVLFLGTEDGRLHKAITSKGKTHIIEELTLFLEPQPVQHIILDAEKSVLFVSSYSILVEIPVANCSNHKSCGECILTRDPYCGWTEGQCVDVRQASSKSKILQDIEDANIAICDEALPKSYSAQIPSTCILPCQVIRIPANTFQVLPCKLRSNLAERRWEYSKGAGRFLYPSSDGGLIVVAQTDREESYECWSVEKGFWQPLANYCVKAEPQHESTTLIGSSHTPLMPKDEPVILPGDARSSLIENKSYWNELIVVCTLLGFSFLVFSLFVIYRNRDRMKAMLTQSECPNMQQKKARMAGKPTESLPLNGNTVPSSVADHKGYQTLQDNYFCSTSTQECSSPENSKSFSESEQRPLHLKDTHVEILPTCPHPRVRLGSEIKDSII
ncbi:hypothetical protein QTP86_007353 [Hemibagrus guttatus]|nr:hypothetical protein QTP86_007353 [Hemibagrus guttatus]